VVDNFELVDETVIDTSKLDALPTYEITIDPAKLKELYNQLPIYDRAEVQWFDLLESEQGAGALPIDGEIKVGDIKRNGSIKTRGSFGNHWEGLKKSWTVEWFLEDGSTEQLKFIMPGDRSYINQLFVQEINDSPQLSILSPRQGVARLVINGIDFGPYLTYEDFDKEFIELSQYGSDTDRAGGKFRDLFSRYPAWDDLNYLEKSGPNLPKQDKSLYQKTQLFDGPVARFLDFIEPENYRDWIASQIFTGDFHQNANNNMRLFIDRATGRYQFLSWDQFYGMMSSTDDILNLHGTSYLQFGILNLADEDEAIYNIVRSLMPNQNDYQKDLTRLKNTYSPVFRNDPFATVDQDRIIQVINSVQERFDNNMSILKEVL